MKTKRKWQVFGFSNNNNIFVFDNEHEVGCYIEYICLFISSVISSIVESNYTLCIGILIFCCQDEWVVIICNDNKVQLRISIEYY